MERLAKSALEAAIEAELHRSTKLLETIKSHLDIDW